MTTNDEVREVFKTVVGDAKAVEGVGDDTPLEDVIMIDSLVLLKAMVALEEKFKVKFEGNVEEILSNIGTIAAYIDSRRASPNGGK